MFLYWNTYQSPVYESFLEEIEIFGLNPINKYYVRLFLCFPFEPHTLCICVLCPRYKKKSVMT